MPDSSPSNVGSARRVATRGLALLTLAIAANGGRSQPAPEPGGKKVLAEPPKAVPDPKPVPVKLPDGTFLWTDPSNPGGAGTRVDLSAEELQKLIDQVERLKKQLVARKPTAPSECRLRISVERRGEQSVASVRADYRFETTQPRAAVALGGRRAFPVSAVLDGNKLPVLESGEEGLVASIESPGAHVLSLILEAPVAVRGPKGEVGFDIGLPRAAITSMTVVRPSAGVARFQVTARKPDSAAPGKPAETRRVEEASALDPVADGMGYPLGPVESVEVTWDPPAAAPSADAVRSAEWEISFEVGEAYLETHARLRLTGTAREWRFAVPPASEVSFEPAAPAPGGTAVAEPLPAATRPPDANRPVWKVDFGTGTAAAWVVKIDVRQQRAKAGEAKNRGPFTVGPFFALDAYHQVGSVKVSAAANARFAFKHGPALRQAEPPTDEEGTIGFFRFAAGPSGAQMPTVPLLEVQALAQNGRVLVRPAYRLRLTETGWRVHVDVRITPVRSEIEQATIELPTGWPAPDVTPTKYVDSHQLLKGDGPRSPLVIRFVGAQREPFDLALDVTLPATDAVRGNAALSLPRFPQAQEGDSPVTVTVPDGWEVRAAAHEWEGDQPSSWAHPLVPVPGPDGKPFKPATTVAGRLEQAAARIDVAWQPHRPELTAEVRAEVEVQDRQFLVEEEVTLKSPDGFARPIRFRGPAKVDGLFPREPGTFAIAPKDSGEWEFVVPPPKPGKDPTAVSLRFWYTLPFPPRTGTADERPTHRLSVGLLWPSAATRSDSSVRIWPASSTGPLAISAAPGEWRTCPPAPSSDRGALPALTLLGTGLELPLFLDVRPDGEAGLAVGQVERTTVESWGGDDGSPPSRRVRFLVRRWSAPSADVELPGYLPGRTPEAFVGGKVSTAAHAMTEPNGLTLIRVPLPAEADRGGSFALEVRYQAAAFRGAWDIASLSPPRLRSAAAAGPTRWLLAVPAGSVPLLLDREAAVEQRWRWTGAFPQPTAGATPSDLDRWFRQGAEGEAAAEDGLPIDGGDALTFRREGPGTVPVLRVPRAGLTAICSLLAFAVGLGLSGLSASTAGAIALLMAGCLAAAAALAPQPSAQLAAASQPGLALLAAVLAARAGVGWYARRRVLHLPGFTRTRVEAPTASVAPPPAAPSARNGTANGSTGSVSPPASDGGQPPRRELIS